MPIEILKLVSGLRALRALVERFSDMNTRKHEVDRDEEFRLWLAEVALAARELEARVGDFDARVLEALEDREMERVWRNIMFEAGREATEERRRMLAYAAVGAAASAEKLSIAQIARVERTLRELDPGDIIVLADVQAIDLPETRASDGTLIDPESIRPVPREVAKRRYDRLMEAPASSDVLQAAGCVRLKSPVIWDSYDLVIVTDIGHWVLTVADPYVRARR